MSIICHKHRFIYLKTRKTASTSIQVGLSRVCQEGDVVTRISANAPNYVIRGPHIRGIRGKSHNYPEDIKEQFPKEWKEYRKVVAIRDPYMAAASTAVYSGARSVHRAREWIKEHIEWLDNETFIFPFDGTKVEHIIRFEHLREDYNRVCRELGFDPPGMPHLRRRGKGLGFTFEQIFDDEEVKHLVTKHSLRTLHTYYGRIRNSHSDSETASEGL